MYLRPCSIYLGGTISRFRVEGSGLGGEGLGSFWILGFSSQNLGVWGSFQGWSNHNLVATVCFTQ